MLTGRNKEIFDSGWMFVQEDIHEGQRPDLDDSGWRTIGLPHDWSIEGSFDEKHPAGGDGAYLPTGIGWYRKTFLIPDDYRAKKVYIIFDGIYMNSDVWVNGHHLCRHINGYTGFICDLTPYLNNSQSNTLAVRVDNSQQPNSRWYSGSGIYRHTWLLVADKLHIPNWGTFVTTPEISGQSATVAISTKVTNEHDEKRDVLLVTTIVDEHDAIVSQTNSRLYLEANGKAESNEQLYIQEPHLWTVDQPYLYKAYTQIQCNDHVIDTVETLFGIRSIRFDCDNGFFLNDVSLKLNGVCLHHDGGCVGASVPERVLQRRLDILKTMGCNAIRMSHNPPSPEMLDMCDRMGFLVMNEAFDEWTISKEKNFTHDDPGDTRFGYYQHFPSCAEDDLISMIHRDRNHPSIILWSVGNEIRDQMTEEGAETLKRLADICHREDPTRLVTSACDCIEAQPVATTESFLTALDVVGYNYIDRWGTRRETLYADDRHRNPERIIIGSENAAIYGARGEYELNNPPSHLARRNYRSNMLQAEHLWKFTRMHDYVAGDFMWTGIDYLGEARWPDKNASFAPIDTCGFPKDAYYFYQSQWSQSDVLHLFPHWTWSGKEGTVIPVLCYTNCDSVELFVNGKSYGQKSYQFPYPGMSGNYGHYDPLRLQTVTSDLHLSWDVIYEPGVLRAVGKRQGNIVSVKEIRTAGLPNRIELIPDREAITADGRDVVHVVVSIKDEDGNTVPDAESLVSFVIEGEGRLIGVDNGKPDSHESFKATERHAFHGLCMAIVQSSSSSGEIRITAASSGIRPDTVSIRTLAESSEPLIPALFSPK
ncbi:DUF4982 domain-containing protein [Paenibacillus sp. LMG 31460]|uniref:DUF4982 domain-containing protein n=1 Tax=Paenibacillus germinis TaxID=2654979 RepID=A0ABX1Z2Y2_9BACL|nr:glycoside hydrolase family 2 TIM barrel-domain containing protein [Paenibacillus germinis]NOU87607.1 DUF4982 domain-containing protein [Paenibacillus germinis]